MNEFGLEDERRERGGIGRGRERERNSKIDTFPLPPSLKLIQLRNFRSQLFNRPSKTRETRHVTKSATQSISLSPRPLEPPQQQQQWSSKRIMSELQRAKAAVAAAGRKFLTPQSGHLAGKLILKGCCRRQQQCGYNDIDAFSLRPRGERERERERERETEEEEPPLICCVCFDQGCCYQCCCVAAAVVVATLSCLSLSLSLLPQNLLSDSE